MTDKSVDFRTTRKTMPIPCYDNTYKSTRPVRSAKKSLPEDEISSMDVFSAKKINPRERLSPVKKGTMQSIENTRQKRNLDSANYISKKYLEELESTGQKKRPSISPMTKKMKDSSGTFPNVEEWGNNSSEGENIFDSPDVAKGPNPQQKMFRMIATNQADQPHEEEEEEEDEHENEEERGNFEQAYLNNEEVDPNFIYQDVVHKDKIRYYAKPDMVEHDQTVNPNEKGMTVQYAGPNAEEMQDVEMNYYRKRHSSDNSKAIYASHQLEGSFTSIKNSYNHNNNPYVAYAQTPSTTANSATINGHIYVGGTNSRKRPTILKRNNMNNSSQNGSTSSSVTSSTYTNSSDSNPKVPPPMSRYPPPKFLTRQLVQMAAVAQRNPNNAAAVLSARKVLSSVPPQLAASVLNSVMAVSQTTNSTPQVIQLATAVATSQQEALAHNENMNGQYSMYEDSHYQNQGSMFSSSKLSPNTVNSAHYANSSMSAQSQNPAQQPQQTASDKLFGKKITGKYLPPPPTTHSSYIPYDHHQQQQQQMTHSQHLHDSNSSPAVRVNVGGKKLLVVGGAAKKIMSSMQAGGQYIQQQGGHMNLQGLHHPHQDEKQFEEIQDYLPHESVVGEDEDNMKAYHNLDQNLVLDGQQIDINEH